MKICQSVSSISRIAAGVSSFLVPLSLNLLDINVDIEVLSLHDNFSDTDLSLWQPLQPILLKNCAGSFGYSGDFTSSLNKIAPSLIHYHGLWMYPSLAVLRWSRRHNIPRIISPHGMLEPWAWQHNKWKKQPVWHLWEKHNLQTASVIHVTSEQELRSVRDLGITSPIAIIPIGVDIPDVLVGTKNTDTKSMLFMSRIHPKKGLENLIYAWKQLARDDWKLIIAGPGEDDYIVKLRILVDKLNLTRSIFFWDAVYGDEKWQLIANADVFVLPSFSENFGIVIAEALACGVPVITTKATPWQGLVDNDCGWWIDVGVEPLVQALHEAFEMPAEGLENMGQNGKQYMQQSFTWQESALKMKALYEWSLSMNDRPDFVHL